MRSPGVVETLSTDDGSHICLVFGDSDEFRRTAVQFLEEGLTRNERLLFIADRPSEAALRHELTELGGIDALLADGALQLSLARAWHTSNGAFDADGQIRSYADLTRAALRDGYRGLRVVADATTLVVTPEARRELVRYELGVGRLMAQVPMTAMCTYDRRVVGQPVAELCAVHPQRYVAAAYDPGFCLYHRDGRLRLSGEIDIANHDLFVGAITSAAADGGVVVELDLSELGFIDLRGLMLLDRHASEVADAGKTLVVRNASPAVRRSCELLMPLHLVLSDGHLES